MAGTRNKNMYSDFCVEQNARQKQEDWLMNSTSCIHHKPAFPCAGINVQKFPSTLLSNNPVDIESNLYGIGANNYIFPTKPFSPDLLELSNVSFFPTPKVYIPILPTLLQNQRPF